MSLPKLSANQLRRIEVIQGFLRTVDMVKRLVCDLEANRSARPRVLEDLSSRISRELSRMRQRALGSNIGTVADVAGGLSTMAHRSQGLLMKIRGLHEGMASLSLQLDRAMTIASTPEAQRETG